MFKVLYLYPQCVKLEKREKNRGMSKSVEVPPRIPQPNQDKIPEPSRIRVQDSSHMIPRSLNEAADDFNLSKNIMFDTNDITLFTIQGNSSQFWNNLKEYLITDNSHSL